MEQNPPVDERPLFVSYAQNFEDLVLWRALHHVGEGTYVDVGAADPDEDSVTRAFYDRGWSGIDIEPVPEYAAALRAARGRDVVVEAAMGSQEGTATLRVAEQTGWSTLAEDVVLDVDPGRLRRIEVPVRRLDAVLEEAGCAGREIHFLKIDVEGFEREVLLGLDLGRWRPWIVVVEATAPGETAQTHEAWEPLVLQHGYTCCLFDGLNRYYLHRDHADLAPALSYTVSPFDQPFQLARVLRVFGNYDEIVAQRDLEIERREREIEKLRTEFGRLDGERDRELARLDREVQERDREVARLAEAAEGLRARLAEDSQRLQAEIDRLVEMVGERDRAIDELRRRLGELGADNATWRNAALASRERAASMGVHAHHLELARAAAADEAAQLARELAAVRSTVSWRVTRPLRAVRARQVRRGSSDAHAVAPAPTGAPLPPVAPPVDATPLLDAWHRRLRAVTAALATPDVALRPGELDAFEDALAASDATDLAKAWLAHVATMCRYPDEAELRRLARTLRQDGPRALTERLCDAWEQAVQHGTATTLDVEVVTDAVLVDVTHTAQHDLQTGIQRVVREVVSRWADRPEVVVGWFSYAPSVLRRLDDPEVDRLRNWRDHLPDKAGTELTVRQLDDAPPAVIVPWRSTLVVPELSAEPDRTAAYRALAISGVLRGFSLIGYDLIPITAAETVTRDMSSVFSLYLAMAKYASRVSAISEAAASDFRAFNQALQSQGLPGPAVAAHQLPPSPAEVDAATLETVRRELRLGAIPMVLVVGSHEPRKNHLTVLEAAEALWRDGTWFDLVFIGGSGWNSGDFDAEVARLTSMGRPITVRKRATENELWAAYRLARLTVFPSFVEGYGLPVVESLASGTPAITSGHGSMAEVAVGGGAILVDPYDASAIADAMRTLLVDDVAYERLRAEARARSWKTWDVYADEVWDFLVEG